MYTIQPCTSLQCHFQTQSMILSFYFGLFCLLDETFIMKCIRGSSHLSKNTFHPTDGTDQNKNLKSWIVSESEIVNWCIVVWCTQNLRRDSSSFMWHHPCNNQIVLSVLHFRGCLKKCAIQGHSHSFRITRDVSAVESA